jgi:hypothetical protein
MYEHQVATFPGFPLVAVHVANTCLCIAYGCH